ncbi:hypothetical protein TIFTF001_022236 [Ficus carica]|uniref:BHLH domain-containing protein n=1 Tax=Ficus carica TaxID=3494 RepID=A0AA88DCM2_FICCA|nr:hypothetical protein TIFTF001_022236 [Ficus carica]
MQSLGCSYVCVWIYIPNPANSSSGSHARRLFDEYRQLTFGVAEDEHVPGFAFKNSFPYLELQEPDLQRLISNETQRQFYQEARIKFNMKMELRSRFPEEFPTTPQSQLVELNPRPVVITEQNPHSSSSSSLRSFSIDSPEYSSLLFNIPTTSTTTTTANVPELLSRQELININPPPSLQPPIMPHQQAMQVFARLGSTRLPNLEIEEAAMTKAIIAVLTSHQPPSSSSYQASQSSTYSHDHHLINPKSTAFKSYTPSSLAPRLASSSDLGSKKSMFKRSVTFFRSLNNFLRNSQRLQVTRPSTTQLHHMISERKRREKLNESFHALRSLLPPGTKKDKASLLNTTREYLTKLKAEIEELSLRNKQLEAQVLVPSNKAANEEDIQVIGSSSSTTDDHQRVLDVRLRHVSESTSEQVQIFDLQVTLRAAIPAEDLVLRILEFLKQDPNVSLVSMEANTHLTESSSSINRITLRLRVEGSDWDKSAFQEAVRRVVANLAQ